MRRYPPLVSFTAHEYISGATMERASSIFTKSCVQSSMEAVTYTVDAIPMAVATSPAPNFTQIMFDKFRPYVERALVFYTENGAKPILALGVPARHVISQIPQQDPMVPLSKVWGAVQNQDYVLLNGERQRFAVVHGNHPAAYFYQADNMKPFTECQDEASVNLVLLAHQKSPQVSYTAMCDFLLPRHNSTVF